MSVHHARGRDYLTMATTHAVKQAVEIEGMRLPCIGGNGVYFSLKRLPDVSLSLAGLALLGPLLVLIAVAIKVNTPGPVLFSQRRVGSRLRGTSGCEEWVVTEFTMYKFRSMHQDASERVHRAYIKAYAQGAIPTKNGEFKLSGDTRITRVGRWLRRSSLDELPQLLNVLKGDMSLVGPRPVPVYEVACYQERDCQRLCALPGVSGVWQVHGRGRVPFEEMIAIDVMYATKQSLRLDFYVLLLTAPAVLIWGGAR